ncbi:S8 family serine peptidase [Candidatus Woesearchaeota archaeon]|nr:S8 family serine peptidase [Candidatus Woesearchaeota archaeon]
MESSVVRNPLNGERARALLEDAQKGDLWYWKAIGLERAIELAENRGKGVRIGIIDTGTNQNHPELQGRYEGGRNLVEADSLEEVFDDDGHGTAVASVICGNNIGILSEAMYVSIRVANKDIRRAEEKDSQAIATRFGIQLFVAISLCKRFHCDIINFSIGTWAHDESLENVIREAYDAGILLVGTAGNFYVGPFFPAAFGKPVISVGGIEKRIREKKGGYVRYEPTSIWPTLDILAPAEEIMAADNDMDGGYKIAEGTSFATAIVTGVCGLAIGYLKEKGRKIDPEALQEQLYASTRKVEADQGAVRKMMLAYDPTAPLFHNGQVMEQSMFGHGMLAADAFLERVRKS